MRLNESLTQTRRQILMMDPLPDFTKIYNFVSRDEQQRGLTTSPVPENPVFQASMGYKIPLPSDYQGDPSKAKFPQQNGIHMVYSQSPEQNVYLQSPDQQQQMFYVPNTQFQAPVPHNPVFYTGQSSNLSAGSQNGPFVTAEQSSNAFVVSTPVVVTQLNRQLQGSPYQVIRPQPVSQHIGSISAQDTRARCHICCDLSMFSNTYRVEHTTITLPNNTTISINTAGTDHTQAWTIGRGDQSNDLYLLNLPPPPDKDQHHLAFITVSPELWHQRLGHPSISRIQSVSSNLNIPQKLSDFH
ncbi:unnamed protein product, partial [Arabidopsis halleri]